MGELGSRSSRIFSANLSGHPTLRKFKPDAACLDLPLERRRATLEELNPAFVYLLAR